LDPKRWEQEVPAVLVDHFWGEIVIVMVAEEGIDGNRVHRGRAIRDDVVSKGCVVELGFES
jgi:hypothetical protein